MFEDRLWSLRKHSPHMNDTLGNRQVHLNDLGIACREFSEKYGYEFEKDAKSYGANSAFRGFSAIDVVNHKYIVKYNIDWTMERKWFVLAHECSHILLHHQYLKVPLMNTRQEIEEEAHFFAQLCFWPVNWIFSEESFPDTPQDEEGIIQALVDYQLEVFRLNSWNVRPQKLHLFAYLFLRRMERLLPRNYARLISSKYPYL